MTCYTPTEIIQAGIDQTRETFAHLYIELDTLRRALDFHWYRACIDEAVTGVDGMEQLPQYGAGPDFGGNELAIPTRPVHLERLTDAGLTLYQAGVRIALTEREALEQAIADARTKLPQWRAMPSRDERRAETERHLRGVAQRAAQREPKVATPVTAGAWAVRIPGTNIILPATDQEADQRLHQAA